MKEHISIEKAEQEIVDFVRNGSDADDLARIYGAMNGIECHAAPLDEDGNGSDIVIFIK